MTPPASAAAAEQAIEKARARRRKEGRKEKNLIKLFPYSAFWTAARKVAAGGGAAAAVARVATRCRCRRRRPQFVPRAQIASDTSVKISNIGPTENRGREGGRGIREVLPKLLESNFAK